MRLFSFFASACLTLVVTPVLGGPTITAVKTSSNTGALWVITDQAAEILEIGVSVAWGAATSSNPDPFRIVDVALSSSAPWTPVTAYNPLVGSETTGIYFPEGATHFFASFQTTGVATASTLPLLDLGLAGQYGSMGLAAAITIDGMTYNFAEQIGNPEPPPSFGDMEPDGDVDILDFGIFADSFGSTVGSLNYNLKSDAEPDGDVDIIDFGAFIDNYGSGVSVSVPEPAALLLVAVAVLTMSVRQRNSSAIKS
jgi:hypothetical protein